MSSFLYSPAALSPILRDVHQSLPGVREERDVLACSDVSLLWVCHFLKYWYG